MPKTIPHEVLESALRALGCVPVPSRAGIWQTRHGHVLMVQHRADHLMAAVKTYFTYAQATDAEWETFAASLSPPSRPVRPTAIISPS